MMGMEIEKTYGPTLRVKGLDILHAQADENRPVRVELTQNGSIVQHPGSVDYYLIVPPEVWQRYQQRNN